MSENIYIRLTDSLAAAIGLTPGSWLMDIIIIAVIAVLAAATYYIVRGLLALVEKMVGRTRTTWDDALLTPSLLRAVSQLAPAITVNWLLPRCFHSDDQSYSWLGTATSLYILVVIVLIITTLISNLYRTMAARRRFRPYAIKGVFQMVKLIIVCLGAIYGVALLIGREPWAIFTALGASAAVLMLVFKDTILGLVASVQLSANKMLKKGDWIVCPKHDADGEVIDVSLTTVKVRNWDQSVTTIPPYLLITESFRNYQPMSDGSGRRVCRSILIDANSVRFCTAAELADLRERGWMGEGDAADSVNLGLLRRYLTRWLASNENVNPAMTLMVRQLEPTAAGLPLQLYFFTRTTAWTEFEGVQSDIFDHVYAAIGSFGLRIYQGPTGVDVRMAGSERQS